MIRPQKVIKYRGPRSIKPVVCKTPEQKAALAMDQAGLHGLGIVLRPGEINAMQRATYAMDADLTGLAATTASIASPVQYLQTWLPGFVEVITTARKIDDLLGITVQGNWHDEEVIQRVLEHTGEARPYGDYNGIPLSSWNVNYVRRSVVAFEEGLQVGKMEEARSAAADVNSAEQKRRAAVSALEIERNRVGFFGYNAGANRTYGLLNDPNLPAYITVADGASTNPEWSTKTYLEIVTDLLTAFAGLRASSGDNIDPTTTPITLAIASNAVDYLAVVSQYGNSVWDWLRSTYPSTRVVSVPQFDTANGGAGVFYLYAEQVADSGSDDGKTFAQIVPAKFVTIGVENGAKAYTEVFSNALAGITLKRPYAVYRGTGIS